MMLSGHLLILLVPWQVSWDRWTSNMSASNQHVFLNNVDDMWTQQRRIVVLLQVDDYMGCWGRLAGSFTEQRPRHHFNKR